MGTCNVLARAGAALAPLFAFLQAHRGGAVVPWLALGGLSLAAAVLVLGLPETLGEPQHASIQELHLAMSLRRKRAPSWRFSFGGRSASAASLPSAAGALETVASPRSTESLRAAP